MTMSCFEWLSVQASAVHDDVTRRSNNGSFVGTVIDTARSSKSSSMQIFQGVPSGDTAPSVKFVTLDELVHVSKPAIRARRNRAAACLGERREQRYCLRFRLCESAASFEKKKEEKKKRNKRSLSIGLG